MKTPAFVSKSTSVIRSWLFGLGRGIRRAGGAMFGRVSWRPPAWLLQSWAVSARLTNTYPRATFAVILVAFFLASATAATWHWYQSLPKPRKVYATVQPIPVTQVDRKEAKLIIPPLVLRFSEAAARLEDLHKGSLEGVRLDPPIAGKWMWWWDRELAFYPREDWPADQKFRVIFDKKFFPRHVLMNRLVYEARTPPFAIVMKNLELYQDPFNPVLRQVTATFELTHSIDPGELDRHIRLTMISKSNVFGQTDPEPHFSFTYGLFRRTAYLRSSAVTLPEREDFMKLALSKGVTTSQGGAQTRADFEQKLRIPSVATAFRIDSVNATITPNKSDEPEQLLIIGTTSDISTRELARAIEVRLLPARKVKPADENAENDEAGDETEESEEEEITSGDYDEDSWSGNVRYWRGHRRDSQSAKKEKTKWKSPADVPDDILANAKRVEFTVVRSDKAYDRQHAFRIYVEADGELYVRVRKGVRAMGDYPLVDDHNAVVPVPEFPREIQIEGRGGLLALNGERKLSIRSRSLAAIEFEVARVATTQINHLVSQTGGEFEHPYFRTPYFFNKENISRIAVEHQPIALENKWKPNYSAFDFSEHLRKPADGGSERGLFFLTARGWDPIQKKAIPQTHDGRFLLVTDIGIVTKKSAAGGHDVFLMSIKSGKPIGGATVEILGKNGIALQSATTGEDGQCAFESVEKSMREKTPIAFVARRGDDVSFIPYARDDRSLNFSRFDIGGDQSVLPEDLEAFVFTERGVYRPGDEIHVGLIVKQRNWQQAFKGLPIETEVVDARQLCVQTKKIALPETGFTEFSYQTANESPTGAYRISVYLIKNSKRATLLGTTTAQVKEFLPDRMKMEAWLNRTAGRGWLSPKDMHAAISLANLYGTPATDRRVTAHLDLVPTQFRFADFPDFIFFDPLADENKHREIHVIDLGEQKTNGEGRTDFDLQLERFTDATYAMRFTAEGFEGEGGRSVTNDAGALVSALPYVIGCKPDGELRYIGMNKSRALDLVALDPQLNRIAVENITLKIVAQEYVSVLTKQENGNYAYQSVLKERVTKTEKIAVSGGGFHYELPTGDPGNYVFELRDDQDRRLSKLCFSVMGQGPGKGSLEKNAELEVKLDRPQYNSGDDVSISITAPYAGSGLITIERDRVYAYRWFQTSTASSVQRIRVPEDFEGSGYINVTFVRALDSKEILVSPLSYGVVPFTANVERRKLKIDLQTAAISKPGEPLRIGYRADRPSKVVIFAVDQGILQVTNYKTPDPVGFYFRKCALRVETSQIVDLIIPEFSLLRSLSAFGGDGSDQRLNPFKRVTEKPVVFWSGIIEADTTLREITYEVPDFFDGTLKIMAVAVANEATGSAERDALIRGPFVITPSVPVLAAPGDEFEAGVTVANNVEGSGENAQIELRAETNEQLSPLKEIESAQKLVVSEGRELSVVFKFRVNDKLGSGEITFIARANGKETKRRVTISVRPPVPYMTDVRSGSFKKTSIEVPITRGIRPEFRKLNASVSALPLGLAHGLDIYLKNFPHGCSEQITSSAFCRLVLSDEADFGLSRAEINKQLEYTFGVLRRRQNDQGAFGYWGPETGEKIIFVSVYVMDFLIEAREAGFAPPAEMFATGLRYLQKMVVQEPESLSDARTLAYAIYILTREGVITTNYILNLKDYLDKQQRGQWENDVTGIYLAGALHLLHKDSDAEKLIAQYKIEKSSRVCDDFYQPLSGDSQYIAVLAREFPHRLKRISAEQFDNILQPIGEGQFNTLSAAYAVRALKAYSRAIAQNLPELSIEEIRRDKSEVHLTNGAKLLQRSGFSGEATALRFQSAVRTSGPGIFFQVIEAGFDRMTPKEALTNGLEVYRELLGSNWQSVTRTQLGTPIHVRLHVRSLQHKPLTNVAIVDLLPGGFEILDTSLRSGGGSTIGGVDHVELREDRAVFFATAPVSALEINYQIKSCNRGEFVVPPVFAESMYERNIKGRGVGGKITVTQ